MNVVPAESGEELRTSVLPMKLISFVLVASLAAVLPASASPSFDCKMARTTVEKAICADPELSTVDTRLANAYRDASRRLASDAPLTTALKREQAAFLARRASALDH